MDLLVERSLRTGDFTLASGARSSYYVDARRTTMSAEGQFLTGKVCWKVLADTGHDLSHVGGLTMGADPVAYAIAHRSWLEGKPLDAFSVRKEAKGHGMGQRIEGGLPAGARCLVVEDSMTTGSSALRAAAAVEAAGAEVVAILTLVDRQEGGREAIESAGHSLTAVFTGRELLATAGNR
jgi:orotate phosphoribosyltransferase